jgi:type II secretory pathway component GspD/PulD (secretin)
LAIGIGGGFSAMENILSRRAFTAGRWVIFALLAALICALPMSARGESSPPTEEKAAEYQNYITRGTQYLDQGKFREAISEFNRALLLEPSSEEAKKGIIKANQALAARPSEGPVEVDRVNFHLNKGTEHYDAEKFDEAIAEWEEVLRIDPENKLAKSLIDAGQKAKVDLLIEKGHDEFFGGSFDEAIAIWEEARKLVPESSTVLDELIEQADLKRHEKEMHRLNTQLKRQLQMTNEAVAEKGVWPEGMSADGMKWKDISEKPEEKEYRDFRPREEIMKELLQPVAFEFECEPLRDVLRFLTTITGINILVDEEIFERFGMFEDCYGNEVDREEIFITIHVSELPLESALNGMFRQHGLGFSIERNFIYISTPDVLRGSSFEQLETRFYHLKDTSRIVMPKLEATTVSGGMGIEVGGGLRALSSQTREVRGQNVGEIDAELSFYTVGNLVNILRSFIPTVVDQSKSDQAKKAVRIAEDRDYGGITGNVTQQRRLFEANRRLLADSSGRQILSMIEYDGHTNTLIVRNTPSNLDMLEVFLEHLDQEPRMIAVEAKFITYSILEAEKVGVDFAMGTGDKDFITFGADSISEGATIDAGLITDIGETLTEGIIPATRGGEFLFRYTDDDGEFLAATINMLSELESTQTVSAPRVITLPNKVAVLSETIDTTFLTDVETRTTTVTVEGADTVVTQDTDIEWETYTEGVTLSISPTVNPDDTIRLYIEPVISRITDVFEFEIESFSEGEVIINTVTIPQTTSQQIFTNVQVSDGDTIVIGGLTEDQTGFQTTGIPFFKDLPLVGPLFENNTEFSDRKSLLIFITVNLMDPHGIAYKRLK